MDWVFRDTTDGVSFASTCLTIGEDGTIVTFKDVLNDRVGNLIEDVFLDVLNIIHLIKGKDLRNFIRGFLNNDFSLRRNHANHAFSVVLDFFLGHWPTSDGDLDAL